MVRCGDVEDRRIQMLELQPFLVCPKRTIPNRPLLLIEKRVPLVVYRPLVFSYHLRAIDLWRTSSAGLLKQSLPSIFFFLWNRGSNRDAPEQYANAKQAVNLIPTHHVTFDDTSSRLAHRCSLIASVALTPVDREVPGGYREDLSRSIFKTSSPT